MGNYFSDILQLRFHLQYGQLGIHLIVIVFFDSDVNSLQNTLNSLDIHEQFVPNIIFCHIDEIIRSDLNHLNGVEKKRVEQESVIEIQIPVLAPILRYTPFHIPQDSAGVCFLN